MSKHSSCMRFAAVPTQRFTCLLLMMSKTFEQKSYLWTQQAQLYRFDTI